MFIEKKMKKEHYGMMLIMLGAVLLVFKSFTAFLMTGMMFSIILLVIETFMKRKDYIKNKEKKK